MSKIAHIEFFEKPVTNDEKEVAKLLGILIKAFEKKDALLFDSVYSDDAEIESLSQRDTTMSKKEYIEYMTKIFDSSHPRLTFSDVFIRFEKENAIIHCLNKLKKTGAMIQQVSNRQYVCKKKGGIWRIIKAYYI